MTHSQGESGLLSCDGHMTRGVQTGASALAQTGSLIKLCLSITDGQV